MSKINEELKPKQHYVRQLHQRQFSIQGPFVDKEKSQVYNYHHPEKKGDRSKKLNPKNLFVNNHTYDDPFMKGLRADTSIITKEENLFTPLFQVINGIKDTNVVIDSHYLSMFIAHNIKRNPFIQMGIINELQNLHLKVMVPFLKSKKFETECISLFENRHNILDNFLNSILKNKALELAPLIYLFLKWVSYIDVLESKGLKEEAFCAFREGLLKVSMPNCFLKIIKPIEDFVKMGYIKGLLESDLESSQYVKGLKEFFDIRLITIPSLNQENGLLLPDNPVCFLTCEEERIISSIYCDHSKINSVDYIIIPLSPEKAVLATNNCAKFVLNMDIEGLNVLLAANAKNKFISKFSGHERFLPYMDKSLFSVNPIIEKEEIDKYSSIEAYTNLDEASEFKFDLLSNSPEEDYKHFFRKINNFFEIAGFSDPNSVSPVLAKTLLNKDNNRLNVAIKSTKNIPLKYFKGPSFIKVGKGVEIEGIFNNKGLGCKKVRVYVFNTGSEAMKDINPESLCYSVDLDCVEDEHLFKWKTTGSYAGNHLAIFIAIDELENIKASSILCVSVSSKFLISIKGI